MAFDFIFLGIKNVPLTFHATNHQSPSDFIALSLLEFDAFVPGNASVIRRQLYKKCCCLFDCQERQFY
jgi:hypothetical protein